MSTIAPSTFTGTWQLDPVHSTVGFEVDYMAGTFKGEFHDIGAQLVVDGDSARLAGSAKVTSIDVKDENLTGHLQSPDFFDAELTPEITFRSTAIERSDDDVTVKGDLTIRGTTLPVVLTGTVGEPADDPFGGTRFSLRLEGTIDRTAFGLNWNNPLPNGEPALANDVVLTAELYLVRS